MVKPEDACPVCGFRLGFEVWEGSSASHEICPSCGIEFGYDDMARGELLRRKNVHDAWRTRWVERGMQWTSIGIPQPDARDPEGQLRNLGLEAD